MNVANPPAPQDNIRIGALGTRYLHDGSAESRMGVFELTVPAGSNVPPPHSHAANDEYVYVLRGTLRYTVGAETRDLAPGEGMFTPRGTVHGFANPHPEAAVALITNSPDIGAGYFREVAALASGGPPDRARMMEVMRRYGLTPVAPPPAPAG